MTPLLEVSRLVKVYTRTGALFGGGQPVHAVDDVSFSILPGEWFALVGESGSGKTTTARCVARLTPISSGTIRLRGVDFGRLSGPELRRARRHVQVIFQDPFSSLNPRVSVGASVEEPAGRPRRRCANRRNGRRRRASGRAGRRTR